MQGRTAGIERKYIYHQDFPAPNCSGRYRVLPCTWAVLMCDGSFRLQGAQQILGALSMWMLGSPAGSPESPPCPEAGDHGSTFLAELVACCSKQ